MNLYARFGSLPICLLLSFILSTHCAWAIDGKLGWAGGNGSQADSTNAHWYYNWWHTKPNGADQANADWIPLVKFTNNLANKLATVTSYTDVDTILVLNEPERANQSNVTVAEAISIWPQFEATGMNLITPAVSDDGAGRAWLADFMSQANANNYRMDGLAFHWYGASTPSNPAGTANSFLNRVDHYWNTYGLPVWITEFAIHDWGGNYTDQQIRDANEQFLDIVVPALERRSYVAAYSFYQWFSDATLVEEVDGLWTPTNVGDAYIPSYHSGDTLNINGTDQNNDTVYLRGGTLTNTGASIEEAVKYIFAVDGTSQLAGSSDWGTEADGWIEINAGSTVEKTGSNIIKLQGSTINNRGTLRHQSGTLSLQDGTQISGTGSFHLGAGTSLALGVFANRSGAVIDQDFELHGGSIEANTIIDGIHVISGTTTIHNQTTFSGAGLLEVSGPLVSPSGGGGGGIVKKGTGMVSLSATNTYEGNTVVEEGTLFLRSTGQLSGTPKIQVESSGILQVTDHSEGYSLVGQTLELKGQVTGSINATSGSTVTVLASSSSISGSLTASGSTVNVGGYGFNETAPPPSIITSGLALDFDAMTDPAGDANWIDAASSQSLNFPGAASPVAVNDASVPGITEAYHIPTSGGADGLNGYFEAGGPRSTQDATFEVWFNVDDTAASDDQVLFEVGGSGRGISILLNDDQLSFNVNGDASSTSTLAQTVAAGWHHAVGVINLVGSNDNLANDSMSFYIDNTLVGTLNNILIDDWSGGNVGGIGESADSLGAGGTPVDYHGSIAIARYYQNHAFDVNDVAQNYQAIIGSGIFLPTTMQIDGNYDQHANSTLAVDLLSTVEHDLLSIAGSATLAGTLEVGEIAGFSPTAGDSFTVLSATGGLTGTFDSLILPALTGTYWYVDYTSTDVTLSVILGADFDGSGRVDGADFLILQHGLGLTGQTDNSNGDADGNGVVDSFDLEIWQAQFGTSPSSRFSAVSVVPEPDCTILIAVGVFALIGRRKVL